MSAMISMFFFVLGCASLKLNPTSDRSLRVMFDGHSDYLNYDDFQTWRYGEGGLRAYETMQLEQIPGKRFPSPEEIADCSTKVPTPISQNSTRMFFTDAHIENFLQVVDHVYIICVKCTRGLPESLAKKASNIYAKTSDKCLGMGRFEQVGRHYVRASAAHALAVQHAKQNSFKSILVLEEDASFDLKNTADVDFGSIMNLMRDSSKAWEIIRLGWKNRNAEVASYKKGCQKECQCQQWVEQNMCTIQKQDPSKRCPLLSTTAYIISAQAYDSFITKSLQTHNGNYIDQYINDHLNTILTPPLVHQPSYHNEVMGDAPFRSECARNHE